MRETIKSEKPDLGFSETNKLLGERWKALSSEDKEKFEEMAANDKKRYEKEMESYTPPAGSKDSGSKKKAKVKKDPNAPKKASTSFLIFSSEMRPKLKAENPDMSFGELGKKVVSKNTRALCLAG